eukprot:10688954-Alexandrium_andersonii.AAC.1
MRRCPSDFILLAPPEIASGVRGLNRAAPETASKLVPGDPAGAFCAMLRGDSESAAAADGGGG